MPVILDPAPAAPLPDGLLPNVSVLTPNESEAERLTGIAVTDEATARQAAAALMAPAAMAQESDEPIIIVQNNWTSQLVLSTVVGLVLEDMGYNVEYAPSDSQLQFAAIGNGDMHFQVEAWEGSMKSVP